MKLKTCKVPRVNRCQCWSWKKGLADMGDWSNDIDRWYTLKPFRVLLWQWLLGVSVNACTNVMDLQWKFKGNIGEIIHRQPSKHPSVGQSGLTQPWRKCWERLLFYDSKLNENNSKILLLLWKNKCVPALEPKEKNIWVFVSSRFCAPKSWFETC